jgi:hypothetical protein
METMVVDTVREIAPGIIEVDEYVVEAGGGVGQQGGGSEPGSGP